MDRSFTFSSEPAGTRHVSTPSPNYTSALVQDALRQLARVDLTSLCTESRVEICRAPRDLSTCNRQVQHILSPCGHASLCPECCQRCDTCPLCRERIGDGGIRVELRLFYKCIEAGLISKHYDDRFQGKESMGNRVGIDVERLYLLFDVALRNNLSSLICHYVSDVCLDESAVSSDPILAFLLDEVVVKDWCKRAFKTLISEIRAIYTSNTESMQKNLIHLQQFVTQLNGICTVIDAMVSSFKEAARVDDLHELLEQASRAKQHLEVMIWCTRHQFLNQIESRHPNFQSWESNFLNKKSASASDPNSTSLFIEEALQNLGLEERESENEEDISLLLLVEQQGNESGFYPRVDQSKSNPNWYKYPFKSVKDAADILFLHGDSDLVVAKRAIFLYYLIDRHWTRPDSEWKFLLDDFCAVFGVTNHALTECLVFYLLDDHSPQSLEEAILLLPKISGPETHPKISQVLLSKHRADSALTLIHCTGTDNPNSTPSLSETLISIRVRIESGLLTEAFMQQRAFWSKSREMEEMERIDGLERIVSEICELCVERGLVDRMIELPWNLLEEKYLHKFLFDFACKKPSDTCGSLLVVFYLQRHRYGEAYKVHVSLSSIEQEAVHKLNGDDSDKIRKISQWRHDLVARALELLPEAERHKLIKDGQMKSGGNSSPLLMGGSGSPLYA
ncbi:hypothetical protein LUZ60_009503 [Juncus effusus]|nr:hypothetical protein LUZ60_009503 [Juncus effusus]